MSATDKELLELAAKATGVVWVDQCFPYEDFGRMMLDFGDGVTEWNPLTDDGDALRLAVKLKILDLHEIGIAPVNVWDGEDPYAATRRAIVRAAAEIGRMK